MSDAAKPKATPADAQNEIDQIMNDIADLQKELDSANAMQEKNAAPVAAVQRVRPVAAVAPVTPVPAASAEQTGADESLESPESPESNDALNEFRAGTSDSEASLESTLADLGEEPSGTGQSLLDQVLSGEPETPDEVHEQADVAAETQSEAEEPFEEPVAEAEEVAEEITEEETQEETEEVTNEEIADEEITDELPEESTAESTGDEVSEEVSEEVEEEESPMSHHDADGALTLQLQGSMTLKLKYEADGQEVTVAFSEGCLKVTLGDGTEFKVPVSRRHSANVAPGAKKASPASPLRSVRPVRRIA